jgi:hypothetical protein
MQQIIYLDEREVSMSENEDVSEETEVNEDVDPSVPTELLEIHVACEDNNMTLEEFREEFG